MGAKVRTCCCAFIVAVLAASGAMIGCSFGVLGNNDLGLDHDTIGQGVNTKTLFKSGRHFLGLGHKFVTYPALQQTVVFSRGAAEAPIEARTFEGLPVQLSVSYNYRFKQTIEDISALYLDIGDANQVETVYNRVAKNWVRTVASNFTAFDFFFNRTTIQVAIQSVLNTHLDALHANVDSLQLLDATLPAEFNAARTAQAAAFQDISVATSQFQVQRDLASASVAVSLQNFQLLLLQAQSHAAQTTAAAQATVLGLRAKYNAEMAALSNLASTLHLSQQELLSYVWLTAIQNAKNSGIALNVAVPPVFKDVSY